MNIIHFIYKFQSYQLDLDIFEKNKGHFILNGVLAYAESFEDLMAEKIEMGVNLGTASSAVKSVKKIGDLYVSFIDNKPVSCLFTKNVDKISKELLKQKRSELRKYCNSLSPSTYKVEPFIQINDVDGWSSYHAKIIDINQYKLNSKQYKEYLRSR